MVDVGEGQRTGLETPGRKLAQGYLFSKPVPVPEAARLLAARRAPWPERG